MGNENTIKAADRKPIEVTLKYPITAGDNRIEKVIVNRVTQRIIEKSEEKAPNNKQKQMRIMIQECTGLAPIEVSVMDGEDYSSVAEAVGNFIGISQT